MEHTTEERNAFQPESSCDPKKLWFTLFILGVLKQSLYALSFLK